MQARESPGVIGLVSAALAQSADLISTEAQLARAEITEKAVDLRDRIVFCLAMMLVGGVFLIGALVLVLEALVVALVATGLSAHWAILVAAAGAAVAGIILLASARNHLTNGDPVPFRTVDSLHRDARTAKETLT